MYNVIDPEIQVAMEFHGTDEEADSAFNKLATAAREAGVSPPTRRGEPFMGLNDVSSWSWTFVGDARAVIMFLKLAIMNE